MKGKWMWVDCGPRCKKNPRNPNPACFSKAYVVDDDNAPLVDYEAEIERLREAIALVRPDPGLSFASQKVLDGTLRGEE